MPTRTFNINVDVTFLKELLLFKGAKKTSHIFYDQWNYARRIAMKFSPAVDFYKRLKQLNNDRLLPIFLLFF